uniref:Uncharacterized protein n=1 Tax=Arundo donax TaxID=35708 RepID=A0A0A9GXW3_ARUDO
MRIPANSMAICHKLYMLQISPNPNSRTFAGIFRMCA